MKRSRTNVAEKDPGSDPESLIKRSTSNKKRQVASASVFKAPTSSLVDFENDLIIYQ